MPYTFAEMRSALMYHFVQHEPEDEEQAKNSLVVYALITALIGMDDRLTAAREAREKVKGMDGFDGMGCMEECCKDKTCNLCAHSAEAKVWRAQRDAILESWPE